MTEYANDADKKHFGFRKTGAAANAQPFEWSAFCACTSERSAFGYCYSANIRHRDIDLLRSMSVVQERPQRFGQRRQQRHLQRQQLPLCDDMCGVCRQRMVATICCK
uniref:Transposase n=1 Tax=Globodera pallida TaxID=36090 RepID=A0A183CPL6_GLOPA